MMAVEDVPRVVFYLRSRGRAVSSITAIRHGQVTVTPTVLSWHPAICN